MATHPISYRWIVFLPAVAASLVASIAAQNLSSVPAFTFDSSGPVIRAHAEPQKPFTVSGENGVVLGQQDGAFEAWVLPVKLLSHLTIQADVEGYTVPIDVNQQAAEIEVRPDRTVVTYAHIAFTVRQIMFSPAVTAAGTGPMVLFEFDCVHPTDFTFRFTPELRWMWPERNEGVPGVEWVAPAPNAYDKAGGFYVLHSDYPDFTGAVTIPGARPGILAPYQERPQVHPVELKLHIDPQRDRGKLFPLLMAVGTDKEASNSASLGKKLQQLNAGISASYQAHAEAVKKRLADSVSLETPDPDLNEAFQWAEVSIEQLRTKVQTPRQGTFAADPRLQGLNETALVAGYYASADSARPGFGWFFGRDALYSLYAVNGYGDFALSKMELEFLMRRQRADGKIMHEYSQTAGDIDWQSFPYMYAAADATPLFLLAVLDYVRSSGDAAFLTAHRDVIEKAWEFETRHAPEADKGGNGIYENTQGTGWVESWPGGMPHQEIYLALLDQQASAAMAQMEDMLQDKDDAAAARQRTETVAATIESQFYDKEKGCYAFSRNVDGSLDRTTTVYPALAWWTSSRVTGTAAPLGHADACLKQLAGSALNTDWGLRDVANNEKIYDGMSYHQGSVWPLFTGWGALAEYRGWQPLAGYQMLMENANLTKTQDLGAVTELLSGDYFVPFGRSTSHQLWSSAMVITPILRGMFGIDVDAQTKTITVNPQLPAEWDHAEIKNLPVGQEIFALSFAQSAAELTVALLAGGQSGIKLNTTLPGAKVLAGGKIAIPRHPVEVAAFFQKPLPGDRAHSMRVLNETYGPRQLTLTVEGLAGSEASIPLAVAAGLKPAAEGAELQGGADLKAPSAMRKAPVLTAHFPPGDGWKTITVTLTW